MRTDGLGKAKLAKNFLNSKKKLWKFFGWPRLPSFRFHSNNVCGQIKFSHRLLFCELSQTGQVFADYIELDIYT